MIDSHAHLGDDVFDVDRAAVLERAQAAGVTHIVDICTDLETLERGLELRSQYPWLHLAAATTPHDVEKEGESFFPFVEQHASELVAIGETGLDYHYEYSPKGLQQKWLRRYAQLAMKRDLPLVIHCRDAFADLFQILSEFSLPRLVLHCFTGTLQEALGVIERGWYVSFSGIVTFKKSEQLQKVAAELPLERILIETDAPYLAPPPHRGKRNEPAYVKEVAKCIADLKGITLDEVAQQTAQNAKALFRFLG
ncbi:MAG: TatD family hydrolase [Verrucomicrobia bacterium]|nr:TatD family hydrolase [Verrucomicrobiota bacterium]